MEALVRFRFDYAAYFFVASGRFVLSVFNLFPFSENGLISSKEDVFRRDVDEAFVVALMVVVFHKRTDLIFKIAR